MPSKLFTMKLTEEERKHYDELAETHGYGTLAGLIRACLKAAIYDPSILDPTEEPRPDRINQSDFQLLSAVNSSTETLQVLVEKATDEIEKNRRLTEGLLKRQGASMHDIHTLLMGLDQSGEVIFNE